MFGLIYVVARCVALLCIELCLLCVVLIGIVLCLVGLVWCNLF